MFKTIKTVAILFAFIFIITSCLKDNEEPDPRTPEMEEAEINNFLKNAEEEGFDVDTTDLGVFYIIKEEGTGLFPVEGDTCFIEYVGYFLDGATFDSSHNYNYPNGVWKLIYKVDPLIQGFEEGVAILNKGAEANIIIPSKFAYGSGTTGILPYTTLLFALKMHDIKPVN